MVVLINRMRNKTSKNKKRTHNSTLRHHKPKWMHMYGGDREDESPNVETGDDGLFEGITKAASQAFDTVTDTASNVAEQAQSLVQQATPETILPESNPTPETETEPLPDLTVEPDNETTTDDETTDDEESVEEENDENQTPQRGLFGNIGNMVPTAFTQTQQSRNNNESINDMLDSVEEYNKAKRLVDEFENNGVSKNYSKEEVSTTPMSLENHPMIVLSDDNCLKAKQMIPKGTNIGILAYAPSNFSHPMVMTDLNNKFCKCNTMADNENKCYANVNTIGVLEILPLHEDGEVNVHSFAVVLVAIEDIEEGKNIYLLPSS